MTYTIEIKFQDVDLEVDYLYHEEEPAIWRYPDGSGHPGSPAGVEIQNISVGGISIINVFDNDMFFELEEKILQDEHS